MTSPKTLSNRLDARPALISGLLLIVGAALFLIGGSQHPRINSNLGVVGSDQFFRAFAEHAARAPGWESFHALILIGPVLWALAVPGLVAVLPPGGVQIWRAASMAFAIAATAWFVAFSLDGFNAPAFANAISTATDAAALHDKLFEFSISSRLVAYLGRISWTMMSLSLAAFGAGIVVSARARNWRRLLGATGVLLGLWTLFELTRGDFTPGPFTSQYWTMTALATGIWVAAFGATIAVIPQTQSHPAIAHRTDSAQ
jgi:hypothetical protein